MELCFFGSDADMWAWLTDVFEPHVMNKEASFYDSSNNFNRLLGKARIRQQRRRTAGEVVGSGCFYPWCSYGERLWISRIR